MASSRNTSPGTRLDAALQKTGARIDFRSLQITNQTDFARVLQADTSQALASIRSGLAPDDVVTEGYEQADGSLDLYIFSRHVGSASEHHLKLAPGTWRLALNEELATQEASFLEFCQTEQGLTALNKFMEPLLGAAQEERKNGVAERQFTPSQLLLLVDRSPDSLRHLHTFSKESDVLRREADRWLKSSEPFLFVSRGPSPATTWALPATDDTLEAVCRECAEQVEDLPTALLVPGAGAVRQCLVTLWAELGGSTDLSEAPQRRNPAPASADAITPFAIEIYARAAPEYHQRASPEIASFVATWAQGASEYLIVIGDGHGARAFQNCEDLSVLRLELALLNIRAMRSSMGLSCFVQADGEARAELTDAVAQAPQIAALSNALGEQAALDYTDAPGIRLIHAPHTAGGVQTFVNIRRDAIEDGRAHAALSQVLQQMIATGDRAGRSFQRVAFDFTGYELDPRQVWEVPEITALIRSTAEAVPEWLHLISMGSPDSVWLWLRCMRLEPLGTAADAPLAVPGSPSHAAIVRSAEACWALYRRLQKAGELSPSTADAMGAAFRILTSSPDDPIAPEREAG